MCFVNFSNHPSARWSEKQLNAASEYGEIIDVPFPQVSAMADREEIIRLADEAEREILSRHPAAVMCQGEFTLTYQVVLRLKAAGIPVLSACSTRNVREVQQPDGTSRKTAVFEFVQFREY